jgi:hypothetical protein
MENFYAWMMKPVGHDDVQIWFDMNNMIYEKRDLFADFTWSLIFLIKTTYLGGDFEENSETKVLLDPNEKESHFEWCWNKTIENFNKENIHFNSKGEHKEFYHKFFMDLFYNTDDKVIADNIQWMLPSFSKETKVLEQELVNFLKK